MFLDRVNVSILQWSDFNLVCDTFRTCKILRMSPFLWDFWLHLGLGRVRILLQKMRITRPCMDSDGPCLLIRIPWAWNLRFVDQSFELSLLCRVWIRCSSRRLNLLSWPRICPLSIIFVPGPPGNSDCFTHVWWGRWTLFSSLGLMSGRNLVLERNSGKFILACSVVDDFLDRWSCTARVSENILNILHLVLFFLLVTQSCLSWLLNSLVLDMAVWSCSSFLSWNIEFLNLRVLRIFRSFFRSLHGLLPMVVR